MKNKMRAVMKLIQLIIIFAAVSLPFLTGAAFAQDIVPDKIEKRNYSAYVEQKFPNRVLWGDTHLHTSYSTDAGMAGALVGPEDAYRFARGEDVKSTTGLRAKLRRPLDFLVVSDEPRTLAWGRTFGSQIRCCSRIPSPKSGTT